MHINPELANLIVALVTSLVASSVSYGVIRTKVSRLEKDLDNFERRFVSQEVFHAVMDTLKEDLHELKGSMKELLSLVHNRDRI